MPRQGAPKEHSPTKEQVLATRDHLGRGDLAGAGIDRVVDASRRRRARPISITQKLSAVDALA